MFARDLLIARQNRLRSPQANRHGLRRDRVHRTVHEVTLALDIFFVLGLPLGLTQTLQDHLLRRLGCDTTEVFWRGFDHHHIAELCFRVEVLGNLEDDFGLFVLDTLDGFLLHEDFYAAAFGQNLDLDVLCAGGVDGPPVGGNHRRF